uniref:Uncharacterized protein n=1 Tax=Esox lucius TaxID=8010 RepID=A0AAY5L3F2_ESOLU
MPATCPFLGVRYVMCEIICHFVMQICQARGQMLCISGPWIDVVYLRPGDRCCVSQARAQMLCISGDRCCVSQARGQMLCISSQGTDVVYLRPGNKGA